MKLNSHHYQRPPKARLFPWPHFVIDELLETADFKKLQSRLLKCKGKYLSRDDDPEELQFKPLPDLRLFRFFLSTEFQKFLEKTTETRLRFYSPGAIQLRQMTPESPTFPPHSDYIDGRSLVMLYYVAPGWTEAKGGNLHLLKDEHSLLDGSDSVDINPLENRMVLFFSDKTNWHAVSQVYDWKRLLIMAEWIVL